MQPHHHVRALLAGLCGWLLAGTVLAQTRVFDIPKGDLQTALDIYARQAGVLLIYPGNEMRGVHSAGVHGALDPQAALQTLLGHSGFSLQSTRGKVWSIMRTPAPPVIAASAPAAPKRTVTLEGVAVTATVEGLAALRVPTELREIPQSVSVISRETMDQQNARELVDVLNRATGITVTQNDSQSIFFFSRGFDISTIHIDGGAALDLGFNQPDSPYSFGHYAPDLAEFDHIEILRGADALFGGLGSPSATVNLVRKQPQATPEASVSASWGSWNNRRLEGDITGPIGFDGALRGRLIVVDEDRDYFYDVAHGRKQKVYTAVGYDFSPDTTLLLGGGVEHRNGVPALGGLPRYEDGSDLQLPRSQAFVLPWNRQSLRLTEGFAQLEHRFSALWKLNFNTTLFDSSNDQKGANFPAQINPVTGQSELSGEASRTHSVDNQMVADATLTGVFNAWGRDQRLIFGIDYQQAKAQLSATVFLPFGTLFNPFAFNPDAYPEPQQPLISDRVSARQASYGIYASVQLHPWERWSVIGGLRQNFFNESVVDSAPDQSNAQPPLRMRNKASPYAGIVYDLDKHYSIYASYTGVLTPLAPSFLRAGGNMLSVATGTNLEAGIKGSWRNGTLDGSLAWFKAAERGVPFESVVFDPTSNCCYVAGTRKSEGIEGELSGLLARGWWLTAGYTFNVNRSFAGGSLSSQTPKHLFKLWTNYVLPGEWQAWSVGGGVLAQSANYLRCVTPGTLNACPGGSPSLSIRQGFYTVVTARVAYRLNTHWQLSVNLDNALDRRYYQTVGLTANNNWYGEPRNLMVEIKGEL